MYNVCHEIVVLFDNRINFFTHFLIVLFAFPNVAETILVDPLVSIIPNIRISLHTFKSLILII